MVNVFEKIFVNGSNLVVELVLELKVVKEESPSNKDFLIILC